MLGLSQGAGQCWVSYNVALALVEIIPNHPNFLLLCGILVTMRYMGLPLRIPMIKRSLRETVACFRHCLEKIRLAISSTALIAKRPPTLHLLKAFGRNSY